MLVGHATAPGRVRWTCGALLFALGGCGQPPSFELSWRIADANAEDDQLDDAPPLEAVKQCSDVGIFSVRVTISQADEVVDEREYPCFASAEGPPLEPGEYTLEVQGLRRNGEPWAFEPEASPLRIAHGTTTVTISEDGLAQAEVVLRAPPGCDDGIDNDRDGTVDDQDPGCEIDALPMGRSEANDADLTLFQLSVTFLDSPVVQPKNVGVTGIRLEVDGELLTTIAADKLDLSQWPFALPLVAGELDDGSHDLSVTAMGQSGPLTQSQVLTFEPTTLKPTTFDFGSERFLQPIMQPFVVLFDPTCAPKGGGALVLERMRVRVVDENGDPLDENTLGLRLGPETNPLISLQDDGGGWYSFDCPTPAVRSNPLLWGRYYLEAQALLAGVSCFATTSPVELTPQPVDSLAIWLERVVNNGVPACPVCVTDLDCSSEAGTKCVQGLCTMEDPGP